MGLLVGQAPIAATTEQPFTHNPTLGMANATDEAWKTAFKKGLDLLIGLGWRDQRTP